MDALKIISYNINGLRSGISKGLTDWIKSNDFDLIMFQEIKVDYPNIPVELFDDLGYQHAWFPAEKKGYSGVGALFKKTPDLVIKGMGIEEFDREGRLIRLDFGDLTVINSYFPSGSSGEIRQEVKMRYLENFYNYVHALRADRPKIIVSGDYNICHQAIDIHDPVGNKKSSGFLPEERAWMTQYFDSGFVDTFRHLNKEPHHYSWWSNRAGARGNNKGWRIDYHAISAPLLPSLKHASILPDVKHSDHCPIYIELTL